MFGSAECPSVGKNLDEVLSRVKRIVEIGRANRQPSHFDGVNLFQNVTDKDGYISPENLDEKIDGVSVRELAARYLLVGAVLDQGPDILGVRLLLKYVTNDLYAEDIRYLHNPISFFDNLDVVMNVISENHDAVRKERAEIWAEQNDSTPEKYNLYFAQSQRGIISINQELDYVVHRWGTPLLSVYLLGKANEEGISGCTEEDSCSAMPLVSFVESSDSAELAAHRIKEDPMYGLGSAVGHKACHLFAKMYVTTYGLSLKEDDLGWQGISYEAPLDSNAGRVLFRSGFLFYFIDRSDLEKSPVIQHNRAKGGKHYIRVTKLREKKVKTSLKDVLLPAYNCIKKVYLKDGIRRVKTIPVSRVPNVLLFLLNMHDGADYSVADFDDGLIHIGTQFCTNTDSPKCEDCPLNDICLATNGQQDLITEYRT